MAFGWADLAGAALGYYGSQKASKQQSADARAAADRGYEQSLPWSTTGMFGTAQFDPKSRQAVSLLSPEMKWQYDQMMARAALTGEEIDKFGTDPYEMQKQMYEQQKALFAPAERQDVLGLEARQEAQGRRGTRGGAGEMQGMLQALKQKDLAREVQSFDQAQNYLTNLRSRQQGDLGQAITMGALPESYLNIGRGIGTGMSGAAQAGATLINTAAQNRADTTSAFWSNLGQTVGGYGKNPYDEYFQSKSKYFPGG
jgi:hypothetical protein